MKLQRLAQELLRHFGLLAGAATGGVGGEAGGEAWQVVLYPDVAAHPHLKNTCWGPAFAHDTTVGGAPARPRPAPGRRARMPRRRAPGRRPARASLAALPSHAPDRPRPIPRPGRSGTCTS
jgi:hypothetical protein